MRPSVVPTTLALGHFEIVTKDRTPRSRSAFSEAALHTCSTNQVSKSTGGEGPAASVHPVGMMARQPVGPLSNLFICEVTIFHGWASSLVSPTDSALLLWTLRVSSQVENASANVLWTQDSSRLH